MMVVFVAGRKFFFDAMAVDTPKLRDDLVVRRQEQDGQPVLVVKDPVDNQFFRLKEEEHFIAAQLDGQTPLETIRRRVEGKFDANLTSQALEKSEAGCADHPAMQPLPERLQPLREQFMRNPLVEHGFNTVPSQVGIVELERLVVYQHHIDLSPKRR